MLSQLLSFMLCFFGLMFAGPALAVLAVFLFKVDAGRLLAEHRLACSLAFGGYGALMAFLFFALQDHFIVFRPAPGTTPLPKAELVRLVEQAFSRPVEGQNLFEVARADGRLVLTWNGELQYFQGLAAGGRGMKRVVVLTFDEPRHHVLFVMKERDVRWSASLNAAEYSLGFATGLSAEFRTEVYPSIDFSPEGGLRVDLKKLSYNSEELWQPLQKAVLGAGWSLHGGMVPGFVNRVLFSLPVALLFFGVIFFAATLAAVERAGPSVSAAAAETPAAYAPPADLEAQLAQALPAMSTALLAAELETMVKTPPHLLQPHARRALPPFINAYARRADRREALLEEAVAYAAGLGLPGVDLPARRP